MFLPKKKRKIGLNRAENLNSVPEKSHSNIYIPWGYVVGFIFVLALVSIFYLSENAKIISVEYKINALKTQRTALLEEQKELRFDIEKLSSLSRVEKIAKEDLKMVYPEKRLALVIDAPSKVAQEDIGAVK